MRKVLIVLTAAVALVSAVNLQGRIGMGLGLAPGTTNLFSVDTFSFSIPITDIAVTRYGLSPKLAIEPIFQFTLLSGDVRDYLLFKAAILGNFLMKEHAKTNVYGKLGVGLTMDKYGSGDMQFAFDLPFGFGLEHFCSEHFSVNLAALSGFSFTTAGDQFGIKLGNDKPFAFYLLWYY